MHIPDISQLLIIIPPLLFALTLHEVAHGWVAYKLGDPTAKNAGRLSLNPLHHLDPVGTLVMIFTRFGWAKPVPVNPRYFKKPLKGMLWVALAGPVTNLVLAVVSTMLLKIFVLCVQLFPASLFIPIRDMLIASIQMNIALCIFNFLPIPPLDGSRILAGILPTNMAREYLKFEQYSFILLLVLMITGILPSVLRPMFILVLELLGKII